GAPATLAVHGPGAPARRPGRRFAPPDLAIPLFGTPGAAVPLLPVCPESPLGPSGQLHLPRPAALPCRCLRPRLPAPPPAAAGSRGRWRKRPDPLLAIPFDAGITNRRRVLSCIRNLAAGTSDRSQRPSGSCDLLAWRWIHCRPTASAGGLARSTGTCRRA